MLQRNLTGEIKLLKEVLWPVMGTFDDLEMEYEILSMTGVRIFGDFFYKTYRIIFECEGFVSHAETITRERFDFEKMRIRTFAQCGYIFFPFSWDDLVKRPEVCRRALYALLGKVGSSGEMTQYNLSVYEREVLRYALSLNRPIELEDACFCLRMGKSTSAKLLKALYHKSLIQSAGNGTQRIHTYELTDKGRQIIF
jgi:DNA-binding MarR family transcriptional regulator